MNIGILGGSFDPVHIGHLIVASYIRQWRGLDEVWLMVSPQNPLKTDKQMTSQEHRLAMVKIAVAGANGLRACDIEFDMPKPSYTVDTLAELQRRHPNDNFKLIIGTDNYQSLDRWRSPDEILSRHGLLVYPRPGYDIDPADLRPGAELADAPRVEISSTFIRQALAEGRDMRYFLPVAVLDYIKLHKLYTSHAQQ